MKAQVDDNLWARAQAVIAQDQQDNLDNTPPDLIIPAPYTIDANGNKQTHEWNVISANELDPSNTTNDYILSVSFEVPLLGYPIALDPTLQFTAPGVSNAGAVITGEAPSNYFGSSLATGDFNADGKDDLAIGAYRYNSGQGRVYIFYGGSMISENVTGADAVLTGESTMDCFGSAFASGDWNGDVKNDLAVGTNGYSFSQGRVYLFYNSRIRTTDAVYADVKITGEKMTSDFGFSLSSYDLSGNGVDELIIGALGYDIGSLNVGRAYIHSSEAVTVKYSQFKQTGSMKRQGSVQFR